MRRYRRSVNLSERDRRLFDEIERGTRATDPTWHARMAMVAQRPGRPLVSVSILILGIAALIGGEILAASFFLTGVLASVAGFGLMVRGVWTLRWSKPPSAGAVEGAGR
jgi:hypothetical protein